MEQKIPKFLPKASQDQLKTISENAEATPEEMIAALINHAYGLPHSEWLKMVQTYRAKRSPF